MTGFGSSAAASSSQPSCEPGKRVLRLEPEHPAAPMGTLAGSDLQPGVPKSMVPTCRHPWPFMPGSVREQNNFESLKNSLLGIFNINVLHALILVSQIFQAALTAELWGIWL